MEQASALGESQLWARDPQVTEGHPPACRALHSPSMASQLLLPLHGVASQSKSRAALRAADSAEKGQVPRSHEWTIVTLHTHTHTQAAVTQMGQR